MKRSTHILNRSIEGMKSEAINIGLEIEALKKQLSEKERSLQSVVDSINDLQTAITKLEKPENEQSTIPAPSKNKKTKR